MGTEQEEEEEWEEKREEKREEEAGDKEGRDGQAGGEQKGRGAGGNEGEGGGERGGRGGVRKQCIGLQHQALTGYMSRAEINHVELFKKQFSLNTAVCVRVRVCVCVSVCLCVCVFLRLFSSTCQHSDGFASSSTFTPLSGGTMETHWGE